MPETLFARLFDTGFQRQHTVSERSESHVWVGSTGQLYCASIASTCETVDSQEETTLFQPFCLLDRLCRNAMDCW